MMVFSQNVFVTLLLNFMASTSPLYQIHNLVYQVLNLVIQWSWVLSLSIGLVLKNLSFSAVKFFFDMKCVVKMVLVASYESAAGLSVENNSRSFWPPIARRVIWFLDGALSWSVTSLKVMQHLKFSNPCFQRLSMFTQSSKTGSLRVEFGDACF